VKLSSKYTSCTLRIETGDVGLSKVPLHKCSLEQASLPEEANDQDVGFDNILDSILKPIGIK